MKFFKYKNDPRRAYFKKINEDNVIVADRIDFLFIRYFRLIENIDPADQSKNAHTRVSLLECSEVYIYIYVSLLE